MRITGRQLMHSITHERLKTERKCSRSHCPLMPVQSYRNSEAMYYYRSFFITRFSFSVCEYFQIRLFSMTINFPLFSWNLFMWNIQQLILSFVSPTGKNIDLNKLVLTASTPIFINKDSHETVTAVVGLQIKYTKFRDLFMNGSQFCSADAEACRPCVKEVILFDFLEFNTEFIVYF